MVKEEDRDLILSGIHIPPWRSTLFLSFKKDWLSTIVTKLSLGEIFICSFLLVIQIVFSWLMIKLLNRLESPQTSGVLQALTKLLQLITWKGNE